MDSQILLRWGKCLRIRSASFMYSSNSTTFISHALSPILTCILRRGLGTHGFWLDHTYSSISLDLAFALFSWINQTLFINTILLKIQPFGKFSNMAYFYSPMFRWKTWLSKKVPTFGQSPARLSRTTFAANFPKLAWRASFIKLHVYSVGNLIK